MSHGHILIVEDDRDLRETIVDLLHAMKHEVVAVENGAEALRYLDANPPPRLILLDLMMPVMDGAEFRERQLSSPALANIPVVLLSAARDAAQTAVRLKLEHFLPKPIDIEQLLALIDNWSSRLPPPPP